MSFFFSLWADTHTHNPKNEFFFPFFKSQKKAEGIKFRTGRAGGRTEGLRVSESHQLRQQLGTGEKKNFHVASAVVCGRLGEVSGGRGMLSPPSRGYAGGRHLYPSNAFGAWKMRPYVPGLEALGLISKAWVQILAP